MGTVLGWRKRTANFLLDAFDWVLGAEPASERERREAFVSANIMAGCVGLMLWPLHWAFIGPVGFAAGIAFFFLWSPLALGLYVKAGGALKQAEALSAVCLAGFISFVALFTGGLASAALPWLLIAPVEAAISGRRTNVLLAASVAAFGFAIVAFLTATGSLPASIVDPSIAGFVYGVSLFAALIVGTIALRAFQRRLAQDEARASASAAFYRQLTDNALDLITRHAKDGTVLFASSASEEMLGLRAQELEGLSPAMIVHIQDLKIVEQAFVRVARGEAQTVSFRLRRRDGAYVPVEMRAQQAEGAIVAVTRDMSETEERLRALEAARETAEEHSKAKSRFLASMSHELRTPLNAIIGFSDVMRNEIMGPLGNDKYREYATLIRDSGMHLVDLVSDLLDMSKIEAGKFTIEARPCELKPLFDECVAMVRMQADAAGVELVVDAPAGFMIPADRRALKQSLINLLSNAIKFTLSEGRVRLSTRLDGGFALIQVSDTGVGIPAEHLSRIGRPFEQVEGEMQRMHKGTGLGLSLVKALAELHGGTMEIASGLGDGTTVTLRLPAMRKEEQRPADQTLIYPERFRARA